MGSEHPEFAYGRYYFGEETVAGNDMRNIQCYRSVSSGHMQYPVPFNSLEGQQMYRNNGYNDAASLESFTRNVGAPAGFINTSQGTITSLRPYGGTGGNGVPMSRSISFGNVHGPGNSGSSFASPQIHSFHTYGGGIATIHNNDYNNVGAYARSTYGHGTHSIRPYGPYGDVSAHNGFPEPSSRLYVQNVRGPIRSCNSYGVGAFHDNNDHNDVPESSTGYTGSSGHGYASKSAAGISPYEDNGLNGFPTGMTKSTLSNEGSLSPLRSRQCLNKEPAHKHDQTNHLNFNVLGSVVNADPYINVERSKLVYRIKKCFKLNAAETFEENAALFKSEDWVEVWSTLSDGIKVYHAKMKCPVCFGTASPQNKEKEPGKMPKWHLTSIKRHVDEIHSVKSSEPKIEEESKLSQPSKKHQNILKPSDNQKQLSLPIEEKIELSAPNNDASMEKQIQTKTRKKDKASVASTNDSSSDFPSDLCDMRSHSSSSQAASGTADNKKSNSTRKTQFVKRRKIAKKSDDRHTSSERNTEPNKKPKKSESPKSNETSSSSEEETRKETKEMPSSSDDDSREADNKKSNSTRKTVVKRRKIAKKLISLESSDKGSKSDKRHHSSELNTELNKKPKKSKSRKSNETSSSSEEETHMETKETSSSSDDDSLGAIPKWQKPGVTFGWVKLTLNSRFQPGFIFPKEKGEKKHRAQYIQSKGDLSDFTHPVEVIATAEEVEVAKKSKKSQHYILGIKKIQRKK